MLTTWPSYCRPTPILEGNGMLNFKQHLEEVAGNVTSRVSLIRRLAGRPTTWGASAKTPRISTQALAFSVAEYSSVAVEINISLRTIFGCIKPTPVFQLPNWRVMSCHVMSCHVMSCHVMSCHVMSCHVMSCHVMSCHVMSCHVMSCHVMSCHVMSCHVMSCHGLVRSGAERCGIVRYIYF